MGIKDPPGLGVSAEICMTERVAPGVLVGI